MKIINRLNKEFKKSKLLYQPYNIYKPYKVLQVLYRKHRFVRVFSDIGFIFYRIPKNASTSVTKMLLEISEMKCYTQKQFKKIKDNYKNFKSFSIVRNPYDRLVSVYEDKIKSPCEPGVVTTNFNFYENMPFKKFVKIVCSKKDRNLDRHFRSQYFFLKDLDVDKIIRFENLNEDLRKSLGEIISKLNLPHERKTKRKKYKDYYDEETKKLVQKKYRKDFELFGYDKNF